jgi:2-dehydro-3-deoxyglucarate aldolase
MNSCQFALKDKLQSCSLIFGGWISFYHPSIAEIFSNISLDFIAIDMEHTTISLEQAQRIIAATQSNNIPCLPRPVSSSNDFTKPLLDSGANGIIYPLISSFQEINNAVLINKFPPIGKRTYGVNRAHSYGFEFDNYTKNWNDSSVIIAQIESIDAVKNIDSILSCDHLDGVMVGPYDISGSLGVPGQTQHPDVCRASEIVINACKDRGISCGTQIADCNSNSVSKALDSGYNFVILSSDLFVLWNWSTSMNSLIHSLKP